ncbi:MAG: tryptophan 7-halogenase [Gammaproteobacteria bacterium]|nr:tryptophan 7-halogenase [Gammaproteobacteria bacterium]NND47420.1 tryptophan 7-halogenase [Woeseiaceae bacterium]
MSSKNIRKVIIVGGGTAGWMAAAALSKLLGKNLDISLIESDQIGTVGVGEATIPLLSAFHQLLGIKEPDFMRATQATFKLGIQFENWGALGDKYIHGFGIIGQDCWACSFHHFWAKSRQQGNKATLVDYSLHKHAAKADKFKLDLEHGLAYAYHLDATRYAKFLRQFSEQHGVKRIEGKIVDVATDADSGTIESVTLESGQAISGDLYIDCSGFRALLIEGALKTGYEDWTHWLPCDRACAVQTKSVGPPIPYTRSIAHEAGWQWRIPLQHRVGNGLVYCSEYLSDEDAKQTLLDNIEGDMITEPRLIHFRTGRRVKQWNKNCVSLGLASGFLEPLESTSIHLVQSGIIRLMQLFPTSGINPVEVDEYNTQSRLEFEYVRDFIILHYHVTERDDSPFWNYCRTMNIPESLSRRLDLFRSNGRIFRENFELFFDGSWSQVMTGQRFMPDGYHPIVDLMSADELRNFLNNIAAENVKTVSTYPSHQEFIDSYCKAASPD